MIKRNSDYSEIDVSKLDVKYLQIFENIINTNEKSDDKMPTLECFENICQFINAFPDLDDEDYYRLSRYNYEEEWFCYLYNGLGNLIKTALDYCSNYSKDIQDMYLHYLIFNKYLGNDIKKKKYLFVNLKNIKDAYNESYAKMLKVIETKEKICVKISWYKKWLFNN